MVQEKMLNQQINRINTTFTQGKNCAMSCGKFPGLPFFLRLAYFNSLSVKPQITWLHTSHATEVHASFLVHSQFCGTSFSVFPFKQMFAWPHIPILLLLHSTSCNHPSSSFETTWISVVQTNSQETRSFCAFGCIVRADSRRKLHCVPNNLR